MYRSFLRYEECRDIPSTSMNDLTFLRTWSVSTSTRYVLCLMSTWRGAHSRKRRKFSVILSKCSDSSAWRRWCVRSVCVRLAKKSREKIEKWQLTSSRLCLMSVIFSSMVCEIRSPKSFSNSWLWLSMSTSDVMTSINRRKIRACNIHAIGSIICTSRFNPCGSTHPVPSVQRINCWRVEDGFVCGCRELAQVLKHDIKTNVVSCRITIGRHILSLIFHGT